MYYFADVDIPAIIGVLTGFCLVVVVPIVGMLLTHQRRMAELIRGKQDDQRVASDHRLDRMEQEIGQMRQLLAENILAFDDRRNAHPAAPPPVPESVVESRLNYPKS